MPGMYHPGDYDLAGFCVGVLERDQLIDGSAVEIGDALIAIASSGPHANGYSLIRKVLERSGADLAIALEPGGAALADLLLEPTTLYCKALLDLRKTIDIHAMAHITGGGLLENLPRVLPEAATAHIDTHSWQWPAVFQWLQSAGNIDRMEMFRTFNCGVGMVLCLPQAEVDSAISALKAHNLYAWKLGEVVQGDEGIRFSE
jgi:phosphoribosylformylglycinamidine cyclo-ligase